MLFLIAIFHKNSKKIGLTLEMTEIWPSENSTVNPRPSNSQVSSYINVIDSIRYATPPTAKASNMSIMLTPIALIHPNSRTIAAIVDMQGM